MMEHGSVCGPVIVPVFKTGGWQAILSSVGSTPTRFRHFSVPSTSLGISPAGSPLRYAQGHARKTAQLQKRRMAGNPVIGGFDSHSLPPFCFQ